MNMPQHITELLEDYLDGKLDHSGRDDVMAWLRESEENGKSLAAWFMGEAQLLEAARVADMCAVFEGLPFDARVDSTSRPSVPSNQPTSRYQWLPWASLTAIAATVLVALGYTYWWPGESAKTGRHQALAVRTGDSSPTAAPTVESPSPAILGRLANCVWAAGMQPLRVGQDITAGATIDIQSGLAQLIFENGAEVVLKGPCKLRIDDTMLCRLAHGDVSAEVPPRAAGFTIRGPSAEVIDLGTRFGFSVGAAGKSEVHVFQGEVISRQLDDQGKVVGNDIRLKQNQAILFPGELRQAQRLAADEAKFALEVRPLWRMDNIEPLAIDRNLALWLRAEHGVQTDNRSRVVAWQDLALGENLYSNDAFQPVAKARPHYVKDALHGRPAIRFDGKASFLTTTPMTTGGDQTIVVAFQYLAPGDEAKRVGGQIINYNGPPSRFLPDVHSPGVLQLGEKVGDWTGPAHSIAAKAFVGRDSGGTDVSAGVVRSKSLGDSSPHVVAYTYNNTENSAALYVDGVRVDQASAPTSVAVTSRKVIGKHGIFDQWYYRGDLGELLIFNTALTPHEITELSAQLMHHYGIRAVDSSTPRL